MKQTTQPGIASQSGLYAGITAYVIWGLFPIYFKLTAAVPTPEILAHRIIWSVPFGFLILIWRHQITAVFQALREAKKLLWLTAAALALSANWGVYIWSIQNDQIFQSSLGYYINPLIYVLVGVVFFKERLSRLQTLAIVLAFIGVAVLTLHGRQLPIIALFLAISFTIYGVIRKQIDIGAMPGLFIETLVLSLPAIIYVLWLGAHDQLVFVRADMPLKTLLILAGPITVLPLLAFAIAARRLRLSTLGILQYIGPTLQFVCGLYYGETFTQAHAICFGCIWLAAIIFSYEGRRHKSL